LHSLLNGIHEWKSALLTMPVLATGFFCRLAGLRRG
jgi:hypothetical protein